MGNDKHRSAKQQDELGQDAQKDRAETAQSRRVRAEDASDTVIAGADITGDPTQVTGEDKDQRASNG